MSLWIPFLNLTNDIHLWLEFIYELKEFRGVFHQDLLKEIGNRWHCASDKKKSDWPLNGISTADFQLTLGCFSLSGGLFHYQITSVNC